MRYLRQLILKWFVPSDLQTDPETRLQAIRSVVLGLSMVFWGIVFAPIYQQLDSPRAAMVILSGATGILVSIASMKLTRSAWLTGNLIAAFVFAVLIGVASVAGGVHSASLWWLPSVPILALILCGVRPGILWAIVSCIAWVTFLVFSVSEVAIPNDISADDQPLLACAAACGIILCASTLTLVFELGEVIARAELEAARDASDQANRAKGMFLANMSHELRTPMNAIIGMTDLILDSELRADHREYLKVVRGSSESLLVLIDDILDFSKIDSRRLELNQKRFDLRTALANTLMPFESRADRRGLRLSCDIQADVPTLVVGDQARLRQVLVNLVDNAIKFTPQGHIEVVVRSEEKTEDHVCLHFSVSDTGIGIPEDRRRAIFDVFEQADASSTRRFGGTGLGLAIASQLVQMMKGQLQVKSEAGRGSTFYFSVVLKLPDDELSKTSAGPPQSIRRATVLVVDGQAYHRHVMAEMLRSWEMTPTTVEDSHGAIGLMHQAARTGEPFHLVLADARVPEIDGVGLAEQIKKDPQLTCPVIIVLDEDNQAPDSEQCSRLGIAFCIHKPVTQPALLDAIQVSLGAISADAESVGPTTAEIAAGLEPKNILLVEDSLVNQKLATLVLRKHGHAVSIANNGQEAIGMLESQPFDLVLMDVQMPEMDGLQATRLIRAKERGTAKHMPIIALTAHALEGDRQRCLDAGMDDYVAKPIQAMRLLETIEKTLRRGTQS
jgi:signal transduction histidine kinase/DNA-binding response OmpR family regulator